MRKVAILAVVALVGATRLNAQAGDRIGTHIDWGNVSVDLYPTHARGLHVAVEAEAESRGPIVMHGMHGGFVPESVLAWLNSAAVIVTPPARPHDKTEALLTPVLVSSTGDSLRLMRRSKGTKWEKRVVVMVDGPQARRERFDIAVLPGEATSLLQGLQREALLSGYDADSVATGPDSTAGGVYEEANIDDAPRVLSIGPMHYPEPRRPGRVVIEFVIDELGHPDPASLHIVSADDLRFIESARQMILGTRFSPGRVHGVPVRVKVRQTINFAP